MPLSLLIPSLTLLPLAAAIDAPPPPVRLEANRGQTDAQVRFIARPRGQQVFLTNSGVVFHTATGHTLTLSFPGARTADWQPEGPIRESISYFLGNDRSKWVQGAPIYDRAIWKAAWPGIDIAVYGAGDCLEYDFIATAGADLTPLRLKIDGTTLQPDGTITSGAWRHRKPILYQQIATGSRQPIEGRFEAITSRPGEYRLIAARHDRARALIIDPVIELASYIGGENFDEITAAGEGWVAGNTRSLSFGGVRRGLDVFIRGTGYINSSGAQIGTVVFGGSGDDEFGGLVLNPSGRELAIAGTTNSRDLPSGLLSPASAYLGGDTDAFIVTFPVAQAVVQQPLSIRYIGGSGADRLAGISGTTSIWVMAGTTDSPDLITPIGAQTSLAAGTDIFYVYSSGLVGYIGGSGNDKAHAIGTSSATTATGAVTTVAYIAGETRSPDFPFASGTLAGSSDGVLIELPPGLGFTATPIAHRIGGSGEDTLTSLAIGQLDFGLVIQNFTNVRLLLAGTTSSPDLPASSTTFAGSTDGFAASWDIPSRKLAWLHYLGGSGADEALAVAQNPAGDLYVGGVTRSTDFALTAPMQDKPGGGEDGWFAMIEYDGVIRHASYYGGSGDDRILGVHGPASGLARITGRTTSSDLPLQLALQPTARGDGGDGFVADVRPDYLLGRQELILANDGAVSVRFRVAGRTSAAITYRSSDVNRVRLSANGASQAEVTVGPDNAVNIEGLASSGEAEVIVSSPGFQDKRIRIRFYPGAFNLTSTAPLPVALWGEQRNLVYQYAAYDPATRDVLATMFLRPGIAPPRTTFTSSNPDVLALTNSSPGFMRMVGRDVGEAIVELNVEGYPTLNSRLRFAVVPPPALASPIRLGRDLQASIVISQSTFDPERPELSVRSEDPARLLVSSHRDDVGQAEIRTASNVFYLNALAGSGSVRLLIYSPGLAKPIEVPVILEEPELHVGFGSFPYLVPETNLPGVDSTVVVGAAWRTPGSNVASAARRPGAPPAIVRLRNTAPRIVEQNRLSAIPGFNAFQLRGLSPGTAEFEVTAEPADISVATRRLTVRAPDPSSNAIALPLSRVTVGKDLQTSVRIPITSASVTVRTEDPSIAILAPPNLPPAVQTTLPVTTGAVTFAVYGIRSGASTRLLLETNTGASAVLPIDVVASGPTLALNVNQVQIWPTAINASTGFALDRQPLRPGVTMNVQLRTEGTVQLANRQVTLNADLPVIAVPFTSTGAGRILAEPSPGSGFLTSAASAVTIPAPAPVERFGANATSLLLYQDGSQQFNIAAPRGAVATSSDPTKVRVGQSNGLPGGESVTIPPGGLSIYVEALAGEGAATIRIDSPGEPTLEIPVRLAPAHLRLQGQNLPLAAGSITALSFAHIPYQRRAGAAPRRPVVFRSSNPEVFTIGQVSGEATDNPSVTINALQPGSARLLITDPAGLSTIPDPVWITVTAATSPTPIVVSTNLGQNLQVSMAVTLSSPIAAGAILTITSSDPAKLRLSRSPQSEGAGTVAVAVPPGASSTQPFFIQALAADGLVNLQVDGVTVARVNLTPAAVTCGAGVGSPFTPGTTRSLGCRINFDNSSPVVSAAGLRPGANPPTLRLESSDPSIVTVSPESLTLQSNDSVNLRGVAAGTVFIRVTVSGDFRASPELVPVTVVAPTLSASCNLNALPYLTQSLCAVQIPQPLPIEATIENPEFASTTDTGNSGILVRALTSYGTTELRLRIAGYADLVVPVVLRPLDLRLTARAQNIRAGQEAFLDIALPAPLAPGASLSLSAESSNPAVVAVDSSIAINNAGTVVRLRSLAPGVATITLTSPDGVRVTPGAVTITVVP